MLAAKCCGLNISETADLLQFSHTTIPEFTEIGLKVENVQRVGGLWGEKASLMSEAGGEWPGFFELIGRRQKLK